MKAAILAAAVGLFLIVDIALSAEGSVRYIVVTQDHAVNQAVKKAAVANGGFVVREFKTFSGLVALLPKRALERIEKMSGVVKVYPDPRVKALGKPPWAGGGKEKGPAPEQLPWGVDRIDADLVWDADGDLVLDDGAVTGWGVKLGIVDTGIDKDHPDLMANIHGGCNFVARGRAPKVDPDNWDDDNGHGTHVAGIAAAVENQEGVIGVAPEAWLYGVKVLDRTGSGYLSDVIAGIEWCIDPDGDGDTSDRMDVINLSLGTEANYEELHTAVQSAWEAGIVLVAAAGNEGSVLYPAAYDEVIAVSATDQEDNLASFSSTGLEVELAAPGVDIYSTYKDGGYETLSGTSMAAPHVTGTAALVIAKDPGISNIDVRNRLDGTAEDLGEVGRDPKFGHGLVDAYKAVYPTAKRAFPISISTWGRIKSLMR